MHRLTPTFSVRLPALLGAASLGALASLLFTAAPARSDQGARAVASTSQRAYVPDEVVVQYARTADQKARASTQRNTATGSPRVFAPRTRVLKIKGRASVSETITRLRKQPGVVSATPNWIAHVTDVVPNDPGSKNVAAGWQSDQWNFVGPYGVNALGAWSNLIAVGRPGGQGVKIAVLDTGVAYANRGRFRRSPDLAKERFIAGWDFVSGDRYADDENGHGTHVTSTIAETTNNGVGLAGLAYGARIMPVRVLDRDGEGDSASIAAGIRFAASRNVDIINLSFEFSSSVGARQIPEIMSALRYAERRNVLVVAAAGNSSAASLAYPARANGVLSVGGTTEHGCQADYSNSGSGLDLVAPGGGPDAVSNTEPDRCRPADPPGRNIVQMTFAREGRIGKFGIPTNYSGTSMATPHVAATAALVIASGVIGENPTPAQIEGRLKATARPLGNPKHYGAGLLDAAAATAPPAPPVTPEPVAPAPAPTPPPA